MKPLVANRGGEVWGGERRDVPLFKSRFAHLGLINKDNSSNLHKNNEFIRQCTLPIRVLYSYGILLIQVNAIPLSPTLGTCYEKHNQTLNSAQLFNTSTIQ